MEKLILILAFCFTFLSGYSQPSPNPGMPYSIRSTVARSKVLTGGNPVTHSTETVCLNEPGSGGNNNFVWKFEGVGGGYYKIKNDANGKYLAVWGGSRDNGVGTVLWADNGQPDIFWTLIASGDNSRGYTYKIKNKNSNLFLAISGGSTTNGAEAIQYRDEGQADINWRIEKDGPRLRAVGEPAPAPAVLTNGEWIPIFNRALSGFKMNINNYTDKAFSDVNDNTFKFSKRNDCLFKFDEKEANFGILPIRMPPATIYLIDLKSQPPSITMSGNKMRIEITYENDGYEALGNCIDDISCGDGMWWININNMRVVLLFTPVMESSKLSFTNLSVEVSGRVQSAGTNLVVQNFNNSAIFNKLADNIKRTMEITEYKEIFTNGLTNGYIRELNADRTSSGRQLTLPFRSVRLLPAGGIKFDY